MFLTLLAAAAVVDVPGAVFQMGSGRSPDERPVHAVSVSPYRIDTTEVSIEAFEAFVAAGGYAEAKWWSPAGWTWAQAHPEGAGARVRASGRKGDHPVVGVTWWEADAYCRSKGGTLPSEAQWEHASCDDGGGRYPWGDSEDFAAAWYKEGKHGQIESVKTEPVATQDASLASPFGLLHAAGNVWEWTADAYDARWYGVSAGAAASDPAAPGGAAASDPAASDAAASDAAAAVKDPRNTADRPWRTVRGGSYVNLPSYCSCTHREPVGPDEVRLTVGFRCAYPPS